MRRSRLKGLSRVQAGALLIAAMIVITYLGFSKAIPFRKHYEVYADFKSSTTLSPNALVRIAGVNIGKVTGVERREPGKPGVRIRLRIDDSGRPIHKDATVSLRPRIFLEGNLFVDVHPGTPSEPILEAGGVIPERNTANPVQLDQILTALQADTRRNLQTLLAELSTGLSGQGGAGYNRSIQYWTRAFRGSAIVNDATLGTAPHDLSRYLRTSGQFAAALDRNPPALKALISDFNTTAAALSAEQVSLRSTLSELPQTLRVARPALRELNSSFPALRRLTADLRPGVRSTGPMIDASLPFIAQTRDLIGKPELRGLVDDLHRITPDLAELNGRLPDLYEQVARASSCQNEVILPWSRDRVGDPNFPANGAVYQASVKGLPGIAAESRSGDANGQWARVLAGNGATAYGLDLAGDNLTRLGLTNFPIRGSNPPKSPEPPYRYDVDCETQETPNLDTVANPDIPLVPLAAANVAGASRRRSDRAGGRGLRQVADGNRVSPLFAALGEALALEGVAAMLEAQGGEGAEKVAEDLRAQAERIRRANDLVGAAFELRDGRLIIVGGGAAVGTQEEGAETPEDDGDGEGPTDAVDGVLPDEVEDPVDEVEDEVEDTVDDVEDTVDDALGGDGP